MHFLCHILTFQSINESINHSLTLFVGIPALADAGNVRRPFTTLTLSVRLPPSQDAAEAGRILKETLEANPPAGCRVRFDLKKSAAGFSAPVLAPWLDTAAAAASEAAFGNRHEYIGEGGSIPFMGMLAKML